MTWRDMLISLRVMAEERIGAEMRRNAYLRRATEDAAYDALKSMVGSDGTG